MARSKLSEQEQQQIVSTYRGSAATAAELAEQFRVSVTTITRVLKENIAADEYQRLIQLKRSAARRKDTGEEPTLPLDGMEGQQVLPPQGAADASDLSDVSEGERIPEDRTATVAELAPEELPAQLVAELQEDLEGDEDNDLEDEEDDDDEEEDADDFLDGAAAVPSEDPLADPVHHIQVLPLEKLDLPETCYVVVDRYQELTTRPLKEFLGLGSLPVEGIENANTLPIFDNHKVARRFSEMSRRGSNTYPPYRVIQFPGYILEIVRPQLQKKGITHLLIDGQIYSL